MLLHNSFPHVPTSIFPLSQSLPTSTLQRHQCNHICSGYCVAERDTTTTTTCTSEEDVTHYHAYTQVTVMVVIYEILEYECKQIRHKYYHAYTQVTVIVVVMVVI